MAKATKSTKITSVQIAEPVEKLKQSRSGIVVLPGVKPHELTTLIIGETPLMVHKFSEKLRKQVLGKHMGEASAGREKKDPFENYMAARYRLSDGSDGVPAGGIKAAIVDGFGKDVGVFTSKAKGAIRVVADDPATNLVRIVHGSNPDASDYTFDDALSPEEYERAPRLREDIVRNDSGVIDIRHRPEYWPWAMRLHVRYLPQIASQNQVLQAIARAGFTIGLCEWRPGSKESKSGSLGTWRIATSAEVDAFEDGTLFADRKISEAAE